MSINVLDADIDVFQVSSSNSDNLVNYWPMNELPRTESDANTGYDVEGSADLIIKEGVTPNVGEFDNLPTYQFDGATADSFAAIKTKNFASQGGTSEITVGAWVKPDSTGSEKIIISFDRDEYFRLSVEADGTVTWATTDSNSSTDELNSSTTVDDGSFHFVAGVYDNNATTTKRIHIDGSTDASSSPHSGNSLGTGTTRYGFIGSGSEASSEDGNTGGSGSDGFNVFDGEMAAVFIYERALSESDLTKIFNAGSVAIAPDFTIPATDIKSLDSSQRIDKRRDVGRIVIENNDGTYNVGGNEIVPGDLLRFRTQIQGETSLNHQWSAMAETILYEEIDANRANLRIEATDFVFGVIANRIVENSYEGVSIFNIVDDVLSGTSPEIHRDNIQGINKTVDSFPRGSNVLDFLNEMASKANSVISNRDRSLVFQQAEEAPFSFNLSASDRGPTIIRKEGETVANSVRVDGGEHSAVDDEQTTQTTTQTVTDSSRITYQLTTRKARIHKILLYTETTGSEEGVRVRIQKNDGGSPVAVGDPDSDMVSKLVEAGDLTDGGNTTFTMPNHNLVDPNPWLIIESDGSTGQDIGVDGSGNPNFAAYFTIILSTISNDTDSQDTYRKREHRIVRKNLPTRNAAKELGQSELSHRRVPDEFIDFRAESTQATNVKIGDLIGVSETNTSGDFIVTEKTQQYTGLKLDTDISAQKVSTV